MRAQRVQRGQAIVLVAVMLGVIVGMAALAIDGSRAYAARRDLQAAVDAASLAAADSMQRTGSYVSAEQAATSSFGVNLRLYTAPSCTPGYGSPGAGSFTVTCTYSDGTSLVQAVQGQGPRGSSFQLTATRTLQLQFGRILTNGTTPVVSTTATGRVNNLLYSPAVAALGQNGCGGAGGTAISVNGSGTLSVIGDVVSSGTVSVTSGALKAAGDVYARCQAAISGASNACYPSGASAPCTYPDVAGAVRSGYHYVDPGYRAPSAGASQPSPTTNVNLLAGVYLSVPTFNSDRCWFLGAGVYDWAAGYTNAGDLVSNELKPPDEPTPGNNTLLQSPQFWNTSGAHCAGSVLVQAVQCTGNNPCGNFNCGNGQGNGNGNGCAAAPAGDWSIEVTATRTDTYSGGSYFRESAPSRCQTVHLGNNQAIQLEVSNVPGATSYSIYAMAGPGCIGPFGLADLLPVSVPVLNNSLAGCPAFSGTTCSLGFEGIVINGYDIGSPWAPNAAAPPGTTGAYPPSPETAPLLASHPNQNPGRGAGSAGDRANENTCETAGGAFATCPAAITPGAVEFYLPTACLTQGIGGDTYVFSGYQYDWIAVYEPPAVACANTINANFNSAYVGLIYTPGAAMTVASQYAFAVAATGGVIASTLTFNGTLPSIVYGAGYAPVPFAARLVS